VSLQQLLADDSRATWALVALYSLVLCLAALLLQLRARNRRLRRESEAALALRAKADRQMVVVKVECDDTQFREAVASMRLELEALRGLAESSRVFPGVRQMLWHDGESYRKINAVAVSQVCTHGCMLSTRCVECMGIVTEQPRGFGQ
jgi:hypothetical protein